MAASSTEYMTIGGAVISVNGNPMGFTENGIEIERTLEIKDFEDGVPLQIQLRTPIREKLRIKFPAMEVMDLEKMAEVSLNVPLTTIIGGAVTVAFHGSNPTLSPGVGTFRPYGPGSWQAIHLPHRQITDLVVKNAAETTVYDVGDDYIPDLEAGIIWWVDGGAIASGATIHFAYEGVKTASKRLRLGGNNPLNVKEITITHISPVSGKILTVKAWKAYFDGKLQFNPLKEDYWKTESECFCVPDPVNHSDEPLGYFDVADPE